jgi:hypothetical protein
MSGDSVGRRTGVRYVRICGSNLYRADLRPLYRGSPPRKGGGDVLVFCFLPRRTEATCPTQVL